MLVRRLNETGDLPRFYQTYRDTRDPDKALRATFGKDVAEDDAKLKEWILSLEETSLIREIPGQ